MAQYLLSVHNDDTPVYALDIAARLSPGSYGRLLAVGDRILTNR